MTRNTTDSEESTTDDQDDGVTRRSVLASAAGVAAAGAAGYYATGSATADPSGVFPHSGDDPLLKIRADRIRLVGRSSDPGSPSDGTLWYRGDL